MDFDIQKEISFFKKRDFSAEKELLGKIRRCLSGKKGSFEIPNGLSFDFNSSISQAYVTLFQKGLKPIRWGSRQPSLKKSVNRVIWKLQQNKRFGEFSVEDPFRCRILFEIVIKENQCDPKRTTIIDLTEDRLEPGIHGLKFTYGEQLYYFMPTDAVTKSLMTMKQVFNFLSKRTGIAKQTNKISERVKIMRSLPTKYYLLESRAVVSFEDTVLPLYRGYPVPVHFNETNIWNSIISSTNWLVENMKSNGQFLYYYDGIMDSDIDFQHPKMKNPTYYNILRHSGGTITLLRTYELTGEEKYLTAARDSIGFLLSTFRDHTLNGKYACYPFFNKKSKLGGAGIGLVALVHYFRLSGDDRYRKYIDGLVHHILSRIDEDGEMIGYFIHPRFHKGKEILNPSEEEKRNLFSFYYPGEALLGLALYLQHIENINHDLKHLILEKSRYALDFLVITRPKKYDYMFLPLPADGWLMQAIEEWVKIDGFDKKTYINFVYNDAQAMIDHMYQEDDAPFFDYIGSFYYQYGEHAYPDGARCEGLMAAYFLARYMGENERVDYYLKYINKAAKGLLYTLNTEESCYAHKYPEKSINSFRFKLTRQWVRVDSVQHTACFYARLHPVLSVEC